MAVTICANKAAPAGRGPGGPAGPMGSGGRSGGGAGPPVGLPPLPPVRTGAAISNAQCNNKLNLTIGYQPIVSYYFTIVPTIVLVTYMPKWACGQQAIMFACYRDLWSLAILYWSLAIAIYWLLLYSTGRLL